MGKGAKIKFKFVDNLMLNFYLQPESLWKTRLRHRCFLVNFAKYFTCNFIKNVAQEQLLSCRVLGIFQPTTLLRTRLRQRCFSVNFSSEKCIGRTHPIKKIKNFLYSPKKQKHLKNFYILSKQKFWFIWRKNLIFWKILPKTEILAHLAKKT